MKQVYNDTTKKEVTVYDIDDNFTFDSDSWITLFRNLGYPINIRELDLSILEDAKIIPTNYKKDIVSIKRFYKDDYIDYVVIDTNNITRSKCIDMAKRWKINMLIRPFLIFTDKNNKESLLIIIPGKGITIDEIRTLHILDTFYYTDKEVIKSLYYDNNIKDKYDKEFLPYEKVRDEFFEQYRSLYEEIVKIVKKLNKLDVKFKPEEYAQRFLGRLMFLYFLQRKGWLNNNKRFIDTIKDFHELNEIFYEGLNKENNTKGLPYLNGSLFEKEEYMTTNFEKKLAEVMDNIFNEAKSIFNRYNFTVDESLEKEVSLDPLFLGTILENMLPEQERGKKGTFYTPVKEIKFMCRRALANYLGLNDKIQRKNNNDYEFEFKDGLDAYIEELKEKSNDEKEKAVIELINKILELKILDPAVGSGGFLVVMMKVMIDIIQKAEELIDIQKVKKLIDIPTDPIELKKKIIPNLYGFDIESEAVEIARLRLWLSLIIDQKYPEPLPNLDLTIETIKDSLEIIKDSHKRREDNQKIFDIYMDTEIVRLIERFDELFAKYVNEHRYEKKKELKREITNIRAKINKNINMEHVDIGVLKYLPREVDIVVMNPPYVRQESIDKNKKDTYVNNYKLDRTSDIYCYFMIRALDLINNNGIVCTITSDKWLETSYGESLQKRLKPNLIAIYGQRNKSFDADINTVITVYSKRETDKLDFVYLESYSSIHIINYMSLEKNSLKEGKWYYLRVPRIFIDKLLPKLDKRLNDPCEIKCGIKTGVNKFFYMKDVSHLFNADRLSYPNRFNYLPSNIRTEDDLKAHNLIYIENEGKDRFVIDAKDVKPLIRTPKKIRSYLIPKPTTLCLYTSYPGEFTKMYIKYGESKGYHKKPTCKNRDQWYKLPNLKSSKDVLPAFWRDTIYIPISKEDIICDGTLYTLSLKTTYPKTLDSETLDSNININIENLWLYLNSTVFYLTAELYGRRLGGGAMEIMVEDYKDMPVPDLSKIKIEYDPSLLLTRNPLIYYEEVKQKDRIELDKAVLKALGFKDDEIDPLVKELHETFINVVEDRLIKADKPLKNNTERY
jgi:hypothetical protein